MFKSKNTIFFIGTILKIEPKKDHKLSTSINDSQRIRVLHILHTLSMGGMENRVVRLASGLNPEVYQITILTFRKSNGPQILLPPSIQVSFLEILSGIHPKTLLKLTQFIRRGQFDIVHTHNWGSMFYGVIAAKLAGTRIIFQGEHGLEGQGAIPWKRLFAQRILARFVTRVVAVNLPIARNVKQSWLIPEKKILCIPNGVNLEKFHPVLERISEPIIFGSIMRFGAVKNIPSILAAFRLLLLKNGRNSARLILVGSGPEMSRVQNLIQEYAIEGLVELPGDTHNPEIFYKKFSVYLNASLFEGMSNTILEAMACGLPVIASDVDGNKNLIVNTDAAPVGLLFRSNIPEDLAEKMQILLSNKLMIEKMGEAARQLVELKFDNKNFLASYHQAYADCLNK